MNKDVFELKLQGFCCSQIIMELGLRKLDKENPDLTAAMADRFTVNAFNDWFEDAFGDTECNVLLDHNPANKAEKCPAMLDAAFAKVSELLEWD